MYSLLSNAVNGDLDSNQMSGTTFPNPDHSGYFSYCPCKAARKSSFSLRVACVASRHMSVLAMCFFCTSIIPFENYFQLRSCMHVYLML